MEELLYIVEAPDWKTILLDIVRRENFDPWDVDVGRLARAYAERIRKMQEMNLKVPANAVLACSILLSLKAKKLREFYAEWVVEEAEPLENVVLEFPEPEEPVAGEEAPNPASQALSPQTPRVVPPQRVIPRKVTLDELISAVERIMMAKRKVRRPPAPPPVEEMFENIEREPVEEIVDEVYGKVLEAAGEAGETTLSDILPDRSPVTLVRYLLALLYLGNRKKVVLEQESPFGEVRIRVAPQGG